MACETSSCDGGHCGTEKDNRSDLPKSHMPLNYPRATEIVLCSAQPTRFRPFFRELLVQRKFPITVPIFSALRVPVSINGIPSVQANVLNAVQNQLAIMCNKAVH